MRFDLFHELAVPQFMGYTEREVHRHLLDEMALSDQAGFDGVWLVQHHFFREFSHLPAPDVLFGAISQRTTRMRLGFGVLLLPLDHPIRMAERVAALDIISEGRVDVGIGRGVAPIDYEIFGADIKHSRAMTDEALEVMKLCWQDEPFSFDGQFYKFPEVDVVPKPVQKPPKLWTAAVSPPTFPDAVDKDLGVLAGPFKPLFMILEDREKWLERCVELGKDPAELGFAMTLGAIVHDDHDHARAIADKNIRWFYDQLLRLTAPLLTKGGEQYRYYQEELGTLRRLTGGAPTLDALEAAGMVVAGNPDYVIERLQKLAGQGIDHVMLSLQAGGVPHEDVMRSTELFGEKVIPALRDLTASMDGKAGPKVTKSEMQTILKGSPGVTPESLIESMPLTFRRDRANGLKALYEIQLDGDGGGRWFVDVGDHECKVLRDAGGRSPDVRIQADAATWVAVAKGEANPAAAVLRRRLKVKGSPGKAAQFMRLFQ